MPLGPRYDPQGSAPPALAPSWGCGGAALSPHHTEIPMTKPKRRSPTSKTHRRAASKSSQSPSPRAHPTKTEAPRKKMVSTSKQAKVVAMLASPAGATIDAMMQVTGWQQHSVRGFLAGVVRKKLKLGLTSDTVDGQRVYRIDRSKNATSPSPRVAG